MTLLSRIQRDLFDFTDQDPEDFLELVEFWYLANSEALSAALTAHPGINLILNVHSFSNFEILSKKLFLLADTLILRDTRNWAVDKSEFRSIPMPTGSANGNYQPGFLTETLLRNFKHFSHHRLHCYTDQIYTGPVQQKL